MNRFTHIRQKQEITDLQTLIYIRRSKGENPQFLRQIGLHYGRLLRLAA